MTASLPCHPWTDAEVTNSSNQVANVSRSPLKKRLFSLWDTAEVFAHQRETEKRDLTWSILPKYFLGVSAEGGWKRRVQKRSQGLPILRPGTGNS